MELTQNLLETQGLAAVIAIHDLNLAARYCDKILMMKNGVIFAAGAPSTVLSVENIGEVYGVEVEINYSRNNLFIVPIASIN
jgi:iron complex transport system ATP-binding protein